MGIRIRKCIGYGLTDVKKNDPRFVVPPDDVKSRIDEHDERYNHNNYLDFLYQEYDRRKENGGDYHMMPMVLYWDRTRSCDPMYESVVYDDEGGKKNVFVIVPSNFGEWRRFDNTIDYVEAGGIPKNSVRVLRNGIYPFGALWMDKRTGQRVPHLSLCFEIWDDKVRFPDSMTLDEADSPWEGRFPMFPTMGDMRENCVPYVPEDVSLLAEFLEIFKDKKTILELRPLIYTYWS